MMTVPVVFVFAGVALVVVAIIGGGLELKELKVPPIVPVWRVVAAGVGVVFIALALVTSPPRPGSATDSQSPASSAEPQGAIDAPLEGSTVERRLRVTGVIDPSGVRTASTGSFCRMKMATSILCGESLPMDRGDGRNRSHSAARGVARPPPSRSGTFASVRNLPSKTR